MPEQMNDREVEGLIAELREENRSLRRAMKLLIESSPAQELSRLNLLMREFGICEMGVTGVALLCADLKRAQTELLEAQEHVEALLDADKPLKDEEPAQEPKSRPVRSLIDFLTSISTEDPGLDRDLITTQGRQLLDELRDTFGLSRSPKP